MNPQFLRTTNTVVKEESFINDEESKQQIHALNEQLNRLKSSSRGRNGALYPELLAQPTPDQLITVVPFISAVKPQPVSQYQISMVQLRAKAKPTIVFAPNRAKSSEKPRIMKVNNYTTSTMIKKYSLARQRGRQNHNSSVTYDEAEFANVSASLHNSRVVKESILLEMDDDLDERQDARTHMRSHTALEMLA